MKIKSPGRQPGAGELILNRPQHRKRKNPRRASALPGIKRQGTIRLPRRAISEPPSDESVEKRFQELQGDGRKFSEGTRNLFYAIMRDAEVRSAFEKLSKHGYRADMLLVDLGSQFSPAHQHWNEWGAWKNKWDGLQSVGKTLRTLERKMKQHLAKNSRGPVPLPTLISESEGNDDYDRSLMAQHQRLPEIHQSIAAGATDIEQYCEMRRKWLRKASRHDIAQREQLAWLMRAVKHRTGKWFVADVSALWNAGAKLTGRQRMSVDVLSKITRFRTPRLDRSYPQKS